MTDLPKVKAHIVDTNVMMHDPDSLEILGRGNKVIVPIYAIQELDKHKNDPGIIGANVRAVSRFLKERTQGGANPTKGVPLENGGTLYIDYNGLDFSRLPVGLQENNDARMILVAMKWRDNPPEPVDETWLISKDTNLVVTARACGVNADDYQYDKLIKNVEELYPGFARIVLPETLMQSIDLMNAVYQEEILPVSLIADEIDLTTLYPNICCLFDLNGKTFPAIYKQEEELFRVVKKPDRDKRKPIRPKNLEQILAHALLSDPKISLVTLIGKAGTGKTLMALLASWEQLDQFDQIMVYRANIPLGRDMGFLPGTIEEKFAPWTKPILDNMSLIIGEPRDCSKKPSQNKRLLMEAQFEAKNQKYMSLSDLLEQGVLSIEPMTYSRGRSIPKTAIIIDEAQNLIPHEIKTIITRAGQGTKVILVGDIWQIDNPYVDLISNGLTYATERFKGQKCFGHITMLKGERSELAELAADLL